MYDSDSRGQKREPIQPAPRRRPTIALVGLHSSRNLGDTAIFVAAIDRIKARRPDAGIIVVSPDPNDSAATLGTESFPIYGDGSQMRRGSGALETSHWSLRRTNRFRAINRVFRFVGSVDAIVFSGGGQLDDYWGGAANVPFWLFVWAACGRLRGVPTSFLGVGVDRISTPSSRWLVLRALELADFRALRDEDSRRLLCESGLSRPSVICPDLAFGLRLPALPANDLVPKLRYVAVTPVAHSMWAHHVEPEYERYILAIADLCRHLILERGLQVRLLSTQHVMDAPAIDRVAEHLRAVPSGWKIQQVATLEDYLETVRGAELVVSSRLHGLLLPLVAGVPAVAISPMRKMRRLMHDMNLSAYCFDLPTVRQGELVSAVDSVLSTRTELAARIDARVAELRADLDACYDALAQRNLLGS